MREEVSHELSSNADVSTTNKVSKNLHWSKRVLALSGDLFEVIHHTNLTILLFFFSSKHILSICLQMPI